MKPKYWNKGIIYLSNKDKVLKKIIDQFPKQSLILNDNSFHALINSIGRDRYSPNRCSCINTLFINPVHLRKA